ncbi:MAG: AAA family ATPase [Bacillota bacterium]
MSRDYQAFFGLSGPTFNRQIATQHLLRHSQFDELHHFLGSALDQGAIAILTGPVGAGKSTALRAFFSSLDPASCTVLYVGFTTIDRAMFREMAMKLGLAPAHLKGDLIVQIHTAVEHLWASKSRQTVLVVDDAHLLPDALFTELRQLLNFEMDSAAPLGLFLAGKPSLRARLRESQHEELYQRAPIRYSLAGLSKAETVQYVAAHMEAVGGDPGVFTEDALDLIYQQSKGIPREINNLGVYALITAAWRDTRVIDHAVIEDVIRAQGAG